jgi:hypothetical protein
MLIRWVGEHSRACVGSASDTSVLLDLMQNGDTAWMPDLIRLDFAYPDWHFFTVWRRDVGMSTAEVPVRFLEEATAYLGRRARFKSRWRAGACGSLKIAWYYGDTHQAMEYVPDFESLVEVLTALRTTAGLARFEAAYDGIGFFPLWEKTTGYLWDLPPRFLNEHARYWQHRGFVYFN